jgi:uncharacterized membrane protein
MPMSKFMEYVEFLANPRVQVWFNGSMTVLWLLMMCATPLFESLYAKVIWVSFISAWALFATHLGAWIAALVNVKAERIDDRTEEGNHLLKIEETEERLLVKMGEVEARTLERMEEQHNEMLSLLRGEAEAS